jgi:hypothetical protein
MNGSSNLNEYNITHRKYVQIRARKICRVWRIHYTEAILLFLKVNNWRLHVTLPALKVSGGARTEFCHIHRISTKFFTFKSVR